MSDKYNEQLKQLSQQFHDEMKTTSSELGEIKSPKTPKAGFYIDTTGFDMGGEIPDGMIVPPPENSPAGIPNPQAGRKK